MNDTLERKVIKTTTKLLLWQSLLLPWLLGGLKIGVPRIELNLSSLGADDDVRSQKQGQAVHAVHQHGGTEDHFKSYRCPSLKKTVIEKLNRNVESMKSLMLAWPSEVA